MQHPDQSERFNYDSSYISQAKLRKIDHHRDGRKVLLRQDNNDQTNNEHNNSMVAI
jgi:hypothetical protein